MRWTGVTQLVRREAFLADRRRGPVESVAPCVAIAQRGAGRNGEDQIVAVPTGDERGEVPINSRGMGTDRHRFDGDS